METKATHFRWIIICLLFALNIISYIDRSAISYAADVMMKDLHLSYLQMGTILGAFGIGYLITTFLGGIVVDHYGARLTIALCSVLWALSICSTGMAIGFVSAYLARFGLGLGEGPNFPAVARSIGDWLPEHSRAKALGSALVAIPISLAIGGPIVSLLLTYTSWRLMFLILGVIILILLPFWWLFYRNKPSQSPLVNKAELDYIQSDMYQQETTPQIKTPWKFFFRNSTILSNNWGFFVFGYAMFFYLTWLPDFLEKSYGLNVKEIGIFTFLPWILAACTLWGGGFLSDYIFKRTRNLRYARSYIIIGSQFLSTLCIVPIVLWHNLILTLIFISLAIAFNLSSNTSFYAINIDVAPHRSASSLGLMNSGFAISGFLAPVITGWLVQLTHSFHSAFIFLLILALSSLFGLMIFHHPERSVDAL